MYVVAETSWVSTPSLQCSPTLNLIFVIFTFANHSIIFYVQDRKRDKAFAKFPPRNKPLTSRVLNFTYRSGIALAATWDQSLGKIPKSLPYTLESSSSAAARRFERRTVSREFAIMAALRFDRLLLIFINYFFFELRIFFGSPYCYLH